MRHLLPWVALALWGCEPTADPEAVGPDGDDPPSVDAPECPPEVATPRGLRHWTPWQHRRVVADLLGETLELPELVAPGGGWPGLFEAQAVSTAHVEGWAAAAEAAASRLTARDPRVATLQVEDAGLDDGVPLQLAREPETGWWAVDGDVGTTTLTLTLPVAAASGPHEVRTRAVWVEGWQGAYATPPSMRWVVGGQASDWQDVTGTHDVPEEVVHTLILDAPDTEVTLELGWSGGYHTVALDRIEVDGPLDQPFLTDGEARSRWVDCDPRAEGPIACAEQVLNPFVARAWRRPPSAEELADLTGLVQLALDEQGTFDEGLALAFRAVLISPSFLFQAEDVTGLAPGEVRPATPHELADRLARALWGSVPDEALLACAEAGTLTADRSSDDPCGLSRQVVRMLDDPRSDALSEDFTRQWLGLDGLVGASRSGQALEGMDEAVVQSMVAEAVAMVGRIRREGRPLTALVDGAIYDVDPGLVEVYGVDGAGSQEVPGRLGVLGLPAVLALTSHPDRTSPVLRGQWVLDRLLCDPVEPAPPDIPALDEEAAAGGDLRSMLEAHRADPVCASCHDRLDPYGLVLEGFDGVGGPRQTYGDGTPVDPSVTLPDGTAVQDVVELVHQLAADPAVRSCLSGHLATWALDLRAEAQPTCLADATAAEGVGLEAAWTTLATSPLLTHVAAPEEDP